MFLCHFLIALRWKLEWNGSRVPIWWSSVRPLRLQTRRVAFIGFQNASADLYPCQASRGHIVITHLFMFTGLEEVCMVTSIGHCTCVVDNLQIAWNAQIAWISRLNVFTICTLPLLNKLWFPVHFAFFTACKIRNCVVTDSPDCLWCYR